MWLLCGLLFGPIPVPTWIWGWFAPLPIAKTFLFLEVFFRLYRYTGETVSFCHSPCDVTSIFLSSESLVFVGSSPADFLVPLGLFFLCENSCCYLLRPIWSGSQNTNWVPHAFFDPFETNGGNARKLGEKDFFSKVLVSFSRARNFFFFLGMKNGGKEPDRQVDPLERKCLSFPSLSGYY